MQHRNAPLTPNGRRRLVALVEEEGFTLQAAAAACNVAKSTAHTWVSRWRRGPGGDDRRSRRPRHPSPRRRQPQLPRPRGYSRQIAGRIRRRRRRAEPPSLLRARLRRDRRPAAPPGRPRSPGRGAARLHKRPRGPDRSPFDRSPSRLHALAPQAEAAVGSRSTRGAWPGRGTTRPSGRPAPPDPTDGCGDGARG